MSKFFFPDGKEIIDEGEKTAKDIFIDFYSKIYWFKCKNFHFEKNVENILESGRHDKEALVDIFRWKTGATSADYKSAMVSGIWGTLEINNILSCVNSIENIDKVSLPELINELMKCDGYGAVYAITIIYFLSCGRYPIYDKYAHIALLMIKSENDFNSIITESERRKEFDYDSRDGQKVFDDYMKYISLLTEFFGDDWKSGRRIDQALWTYGHMFSDNETNRKNRLGASFC